MSDLRDAAGNQGIELVEADMLGNKYCFDKLVDRGVHYIVHTACPFIQGRDEKENANHMNSYIEAT